MVKDTFTIVHNYISSYRYRTDMDVYKGSHIDMDTGTNIYEYCWMKIQTPIQMPSFFKMHFKL